jgi:hypothetical protein
MRSSGLNLKVPFLDSFPDDNPEREQKPSPSWRSGAQPTYHLAAQFPAARRRGKSEAELCIKPT